MGGVSTFTPFIPVLIRDKPDSDYFTVRIQPNTYSPFRETAQQDPAEGFDGVGFYFHPDRSIAQAGDDCCNFLQSAAIG